MAVQHFCIPLFIFLQISVALCRSTESPLQDGKGKMHYDFYTEDPFITYYNTALTAYAIVAIIIGVFSLLSLILGCIMFIYCKKEPRRGYVVNPNTQGQTGGIQQPTPGNVHQMQAYPPSYGQQQQNVYPSIHPTK